MLTKLQLYRAFEYITDCEQGSFEDDTNGLVQETRENIFINIVNRFNQCYNGEHNVREYPYLRQRLAEYMRGLGLSIEYSDYGASGVWAYILTGVDTPQEDWQEEFYFQKLTDMLAETIIYYANVYNLTIGDKYAVNRFNDNNVEFLANIHTNKYNSCIIQIDLICKDSTKKSVNYCNFNCGKDFVGKRMAKCIAFDNNIKIV